MTPIACEDNIPASCEQFSSSLDGFGAFCDSNGGGNENIVVFFLPGMICPSQSSILQECTITENGVPYSNGDEVSTFIFETCGSEGCALFIEYDLSAGPQCSIGNEVVVSCPAYNLSDCPTTVQPQGS